ncbi:hypothetical protein MP228_006278 [Amoeboaphelidium protococcarum]|nr:hypothetical protein MP228_006278 [Amoeboaphelidium protococcarum]
MPPQQPHQPFNSNHQCWRPAMWTSDTILPYRHLGTTVLFLMTRFLAVVTYHFAVFGLGQQCLVMGLLRLHQSEIAFDSHKLHKQLVKIIQVSGSNQVIPQSQDELGNKKRYLNAVKHAYEQDASMMTWTTQSLNSSQDDPKTSTQTMCLGHLLFFQADHDAQIYGEQIHSQCLLQQHQKAPFYFGLLLKCLSGGARPKTA